MTVRKMFSIISASPDLIKSDTIVFIKDNHGKIVFNNLWTKEGFWDCSELEIICFSINVLTNTLHISVAN